MVSPGSNTRESRRNPRPTNQSSNLRDRSRTPLDRDHNNVALNTIASNNAQNEQNLPTEAQIHDNIAKIIKLLRYRY